MKPKRTPDTKKTSTIELRYDHPYDDILKAMEQLTWNSGDSFKFGMTGDKDVS